MRSFNSILVANRGEIAVRVFRTARALGYRTIAVYSEADRDAPHVRMADEAVLIGPAPVGSSYLDMDRILQAAKDTGAEAIHPGYGFLSENAAFVQACEAAGIVFIGPTAEAVDLMGNKAAAKRRMIDAGVPCVPGYEGEDQSDATMIAKAAEIGFPVMVKAAAGGGGRGMRLVTRADDLPTALERARSEAQNAFGSGELILEKAIMRPRHVEVQVFADTHGNVIHFGERDCSVQRRHQKVVEEAPCPVMTPPLRTAMGAAAVEAARSIGYRGAGTVEFLLDADGAFYFLEMNTRLQVEHPVTEEITGQDLVALQIAVAQGQTLGLTQDDVTLTGHAIEIRLYAEDPAQDFMPATGRITAFSPATGPGIRFDAGVTGDAEVSPFYDPMIAKVIAHGPDRETARCRLIQALQETPLFGLTTNRAFLIDVLSRETFARGQATTAFIAEEFTEADLAETVPDAATAAGAAVLHYLAEQDDAAGAALNVTSSLLGWHSGGQLATRYTYAFGGGDDETVHDLLVMPQRDGTYRVTGAAEPVTVAVLSRGDGRATLAIDGGRHHLLWHQDGRGVLDVSVAGRNIRFRNRIAFPAAAEAAAGGGRVVAPMHGSLVQILVEAGAEVTAGTRLAVLEAMKMQHDILAEIDGTVTEVLVSAGTQVGADDLLMEIEPAA